MSKERTSSRLIAALCSLVCLIFAPMGLTACAPPRDTNWERVQETGVLRVGMDASFPPFESINSEGTLVGFDVDLARELGRRLDLEVHFVANLPYDGLYDALTAGKVDVVISALAVNPARMGDFTYSIPYFDAGQVLVVRERETDIDEMADLSGHTLAVALGTQGDREAREWSRRLKDLDVMTHQTANEALNPVKSGAANAALVDRVSALKAVSAASDLLIAAPPVVEVPYAVAIRENSPRMLRAVNEALANMKADGTLEALIERWMSANATGSD